jgi:hypothetical protein
MASAETFAVDVLARVPVDGADRPYWADRAAHSLYFDVATRLLVERLA